MNKKEEFLSTKVSKDRLNLAISPRQKFRIEETYNLIKQDEKEKNKEYYKNLSSWIRRGLDLIIKIFKSGKNYEFVEQNLNTDVKELIRKNSHMQITLLQEENIKFHKYIRIDKSLYSLIMSYVDIIQKRGLLEDEKLLAFFDNIRNLLFSNKLTKEFKAEILGNDYILTYVGTHQNIHYEQTKGIIAIAGVLGFELQTILYTPRYAKLTMKKTQLINSPGASFENRIALLNKNLDKILNFHYILNDEKTHSWIRLSNFNESIISFKNYEYGKKAIEEIIEELLVHSLENFEKDLLLLFEKLNWIDIEKPIKNNNLFSCLIGKESFEYKLMMYFFEKYRINQNFSEKTISKFS